MATEAHIIADYFTAEDKTLVFTVYQSDNVTIQSLTGFSALSWMLKLRRGDADVDALIEKTLASSVVITDAANGLVEVTLTSADIVSLSPDADYFHELKRMDSPKTVLSYGRFALQHAVHTA